MSFRPHRSINVCLIIALAASSFGRSLSAQPTPPPPPQLQEDSQNQADSQREPVPLPPSRVATQPAVTQRQLFRTAFGRSPFSPSRQRLTRAPDMFGDMLLPGPGLIVTEPCQDPNQFPCPEVTQLALIQPGGGGFKISDNGEVLPVDRVFVNYNHFHNPLGLQSLNSFASGNYDRATLGVEKTFANGAHSIEMRLPFSGGINTTLNRPIQGPIGIGGGNLGNLTLVFKTLLYQDRSTAFGGGLALGIPTGEDLFVNTSTAGTFQFENQAFHLHPYLGLLHMTDDGAFFSSYLQFDAGLNGNPLYQTTRPPRPMDPGPIDPGPIDPGPIDGEPGPIGGAPYQTAGSTTQRLGNLSPLSLVMVDIGAGKWIYRNLEKDGITGIAPLVELHYLSTIDQIDGLSNGASRYVRTVRNSFQSLNLTAGTHVEINGYSALRVAAVAPLLGQNFRTFDAEVQVQYTIHY